MSSSDSPARVRWPFYAIVAVFVGLHVYICKRLGFDPEWGYGLSGVSVAVTTALCFTVPVRFAQRSGDMSRARARTWAWVTFSWMGYAFLVVVGLALSDLVLFLLGQYTDVLAGWLASEVARAQAIFVLISVSGLSMLAGYNALRTPPVRRVHLTLPGWPESLDGYKIVQLSDIHVGAIIGRHFLTRVVERCNSCSADLVVLTGDLVDGPVEHYAAELAPFEALESRQGVYMVIGNHDHYANEAEWVPEFESRGLHCLRNTHRILGEGDARFVLAGIDDTSSVHATKIAELVATSLRATPNDLPRLLLAHNPNAFDAATQEEVMLQLSGHTHGGQIWPFNLLVRLAHREIAGLYGRGSLPSQLYVSRGTGFWGPPMRLGASSEITELTLSSARSDG